VISFWRYIVLIQLRLDQLVSYITAFPLVTDSTMQMFCKNDHFTFGKMADSRTYKAYILGGQIGEVCCILFFCSISCRMHSEHINWLDCVVHLPFWLRSQCKVKDKFQIVAGNQLMS
jgi:hypothetical protein